MPCTADRLCCRPFHFHFLVYRRGYKVRAVEPMQAWRMHCLAAVSRESFPPLAALACAVAVWNATILLWLAAAIAN